MQLLVLPLRRTPTILRLDSNLLPNPPGSADLGRLDVPGVILDPSRLQTRQAGQVISSGVCACHGVVADGAHLALLLGVVCADSCCGAELARCAAFDDAFLCISGANRSRDGASRKQKHRDPRAEAEKRRHGSHEPLRSFREAEGFAQSFVEQAVDDVVQRAMEERRDAVKQEVDGVARNGSVGLFVDHVFCFVRFGPLCHRLARVGYTGDAHAASSMVPDGEERLFLERRHLAPFIAVDPMSWLEQEERESVEQVVVADLVLPAAVQEVDAGNGDGTSWVGPVLRDELVTGLWHVVVFQVQRRKREEGHRADQDCRVHEATRCVL